MQGSPLKERGKISWCGSKRRSQGLFSTYIFRNKLLFHFFSPGENIKASSFSSKGKAKFLMPVMIAILSINFYWAAPSGQINSTAGVESSGCCSRRGALEVKDRMSEDNTWKKYTCTWLHKHAFCVFSCSFLSTVPHNNKKLRKNTMFASQYLLLYDLSEANPPEVQQQQPIRFQPASGNLSPYRWSCPVLLLLLSSSFFVAVISWVAPPPPKKTRSLSPRV